MNPSITVLMPVYNGEKYLKEAIDSILNQTFIDFEFIIVNDGSTDKTQDIILSYKDKRIKLINQSNGGVAHALNTGLKSASGSFIARMDADDISYAGRLQMQYEFMLKNPEYIIIGADANYIDESGEFVFTYINPSYTHEEIKRTIKQTCPFIHSTVFFRKNYAMDLLGYPERAHSFEDHLLWTKFIEVGKMCNLNSVLVEYRFNFSSVTIDERDMDSRFIEIKRKALQTGHISEEESKQLFLYTKKLSPRKKEISYNRMLGKKFLWNNYNPTKARGYILKSLKMEPVSAMSYVLLMLSFFPQSFINRLYRFMK